MKNIIELRKLSKVYKDVTTVDLEKITVREGEIYGFLGPNGAGKTTTMKMVLSFSNAYFWRDFSSWSEHQKKIRLI